MTTFKFKCTWLICLESPPSGIQHGKIGTPSSSPGKSAVIAQDRVPDLMLSYNGNLTIYAAVAGQFYAPN